MGIVLKILLLIILIICAVLWIMAFINSKNRWKTMLSSFGIGIVSLLAVHFLSFVLPIHIPLSAASVLVSGFLGVPGVVLQLLMPAVW